MLNRRNLIKQKIISGLLLVSVFGMLFAGKVFAGNIVDKDYGFNYSGDGGDLYTPYEEKWDYTSSYVYHQGTVGAYIGVYYGYTSYGPHYSVGVGEERYLINYIKENGLNICRLRITPSTHSPIYIYGRWSPDSV